MKLIQQQQYQPLPRIQARLSQMTNEQRELMALAFSEFIDTAVMATARGTFYNSQLEVNAAVDSIHNDLFSLDRDVYNAALLLPGVTDFNRQQGAVRLLNSSQQEGIFDSNQQSEAVRQIVGQLPPQRMLKLFVQLSEQRVNNARTRKLILNSLLNSNSLEFWSVKYRRKLAKALTHAWGRSLASIIKSILAKPSNELSQKELQIIQQHVFRFVPETKREAVVECIRFILSGEGEYSLPRLRAYQDAKDDLTKGRSLPYETLEGIRSRFHRQRSSTEVLELTKANLTSGQKLVLQRTAKQADVRLEFQPDKHDAVRLYLYAYEMGMNDEIRKALREKAKQAAARFPAHFAHIGILVDTSQSMSGDQTQARRPIAIALALRDALAAAADQTTILTSAGSPAPVTELVDTVGDTSLVSGLISLLKQDPEVIFVISDGYENAPAGRFHEVVRTLRSIGIETPIRQFSPVMAAESRGVRALCDSVPRIPVNQPESIGLGLLKTLFESNLEQGIHALLQLAQASLHSNGIRNRDQQSAVRLATK